MICGACAQEAEKKAKREAEEQARKVRSPALRFSILTHTATTFVLWVGQRIKMKSGYPVCDGGIRKTLHIGFELQLLKQCINCFAPVALASRPGTASGDSLQEH